MYAVEVVTADGQLRRATQINEPDLFWAVRGIGLLGDWGLAEDCAQDAFAAALVSWPREGVPRRPGAWLTTAARNRAIDRLRRDAAGAARLRQLAVLARDPVESPVEEIPDERLRLIFTCCHPALPFPARVALTLRTLAGLSTAEIARALLTAEPAMAQRLVRAKRKIAEAGIPYRVPPSELSSSLDGETASSSQISSTYFMRWIVPDRVLSAQPRHHPGDDQRLAATRQSRMLTEAAASRWGRWRSQVYG